MTITITKRTIVHANEPWQSFGIRPAIFESKDRLKCLFPITGIRKAPKLSFDRQAPQKQPLSTSEASNNIACCRLKHAAGFHLFCLLPELHHLPFSPWKGPVREQFVCWAGRDVRMVHRVHAIVKPHRFCRYQYFLPLLCWAPVFWKRVLLSFLNVIFNSQPPSIL